jgi:hypothetical protein
MIDCTWQQLGIVIEEQYELATGQLGSETPTARAPEVPVRAMQIGVGPQPAGFENARRSAI